MAAPDVLALVEAAYALEGGPGKWLQGLAAAAENAFGLPNIGAYALTYDASDIHAFRVDRLATSRVFDAAKQDLLDREFIALYRRTPALTEAVFRRTAYGSAHALPLPELLRETFERMRRAGIGDILGLNGVNTDGRSVHVGVLLANEMPGPNPEVLARLSSHLAASHRLRARLGEPGVGESGSRVPGHGAELERADAVLTASGKVEHAAGKAKLPQAREALVSAAMAIARARGPLRRRDPERAVAQWRALVDATWSLVDRFERDGKHYLVAYRNEPAAGAIAQLSERERQVTALAAAGHANKMIGYELGIAVSTVGVLLGRAARRLNLGTRAELVALYEAHETVRSDAQRQ